MNILDVILIVIVIGSFLRGYQQGLIRQAINFLGFFIAIFVAYKFSKELVPFLQNTIPAPNFEQTTPALQIFSETFQVQDMFYNAIAFILLFFATKIALQIAGGILHQVASLPGLAIVNRLSGAVMGAVQGIILIIIVVSVISVMPWQGLDQYLASSSVSQFFLNLVPIFTELLYNLWNTTI